MTWREKATSLYRRRRAHLVKSLGGKCRKCGSARRLELHHVRGRDWVAAQLARHQRIVRYERDARAGLLVLLCARCHRLEAGCVGSDDNVAAGVA